MRAWAVVGLLGWAAQASPGGERVGSMPEFQVTVDKVASFQQADPKADGELKLKDGTTCTVSRQLAWFDVWAKLLAKSQELGWPVYVGCDPTSRQVKVLLPATTDNVQSVAPDPKGDRLRVQFRGSHAIHVLKNTRPRYEDLKKELEQAAADGHDVWVTSDPREMEIVDVRPAPAATPAPAKP